MAVAAYHDGMDSSIPGRRQERLSGFTREVIRVIEAIPEGTVASYGQVARLAGSASAARQVVRVLHTQSDRLGLPWHRVVARDGRIALGKGRGYETQLRLLKCEGVRPGPDGRISMRRFGWKPPTRTVDGRPVTETRPVKHE
jgi:methylated-DNA-protein-cysteine methyltransferase-like protein